MIAEDRKMLRDMLRGVFESDPEAGIKVVAEAGDGREAVQCVERHHPDLVPMDLSMPGMNGHQAVFEIKKSFPSTRILVLTMYASQEVIMGALKAGADGYMLKNDSLGELRVAIRDVLQGSSHLCKPWGRWYVLKVIDSGCWLLNARISYPFCLNMPSLFTDFGLVPNSVIRCDAGFLAGFPFSSTWMNLTP